MTLRQSSSRKPAARISAVAGMTMLLCGAFAQAATSPDDASQSDRYHEIINELRCLVCQNQTIAESNAPLAVDLREQVKKQLGEGKSKAEITRYLTDRYGDFVLYRPPFKASTVLLWAGPFLLLLVGLVGAWRWMRATRPPRPRKPSMDEAAVQKLVAETRVSLAAQDGKDS